MNGSITNHISGVDSESAGPSSHNTTPDGSLTLLSRFFFLTYFLVLVNTAGCFRQVEWSDPLTALFSAAVWLTYSLFYLLPVVLLVMLVYGLLSIPGMRGVISSRGRHLIAVGLALIGTAALQVALHADRQVFSLYGFHFNGFVWNLIRTPGGIESMGMNQSSQISVAMIVTVICAVQAMLLAMVIYSRRIKTVIARIATKRKIIAAVALIVIAALFERAAYGVCSLRSYRPVLAASRAFPLYLPTTINKLAESMGVNVERHPTMTVASHSMTAYPRVPIRREPIKQLPNFVWLVSESLRADMLDPEIMPNSWKLAQQSVWCRQHYSGGNGTRMGMFSMFYGLYGCLWFPIIEEQRAPVLMNVLRDAGYQMEMFTSASFTYPEFDRTMFVNVPLEKQHASTRAIQWQRDEGNVDEILKFMQKRDPARPFMTFMFFESPHAPYHFPAEAVIRQPFVDSLNYLKLDEHTDIAPVKNRYINACHYLDSQIGRILSYLKEQKLMESTIVIVTGDHGEEFMEKGRWGHNSTFSEEQTRPPFVLWAPGIGHREVTGMTSHLDIPATLLPLLGVTNPPRDFSLGCNILGNQPRNYTVICDWDRIAYVDGKYKFVSVFNSYDPSRQSVTTREDKPVSETDAVKSDRAKGMGTILGDLKTLSR